MRIVIDMQGAQSESRFRGIGRYSLSIAQAIARNAQTHEIILVLNSMLSDTVGAIRAAFDGILPQDQIRVWDGIGPTREVDPANDKRRAMSERIREAFIESLHPDVVLITSLFEGLGDDTVTSVGVFDNRTPVAVILYDLIPLISPDKHFLNSKMHQDFYQRKITSLRHCGLLLAISESARQEALTALDTAPEDVINVSGACDASFKKLALSADEIKALKTKYQIDRSFVMYTGGADERKNLVRLIQAFGSLPKEVRQAHQLVFAGKMPTDYTSIFRKAAKDAGLSASDLIITGYLEDQDLLKLYNCCELFIFPSLHEGFGLPPLEAMACGAPVIAANASSLPEVIGLPEALFDPKSVQSISAKLCHALTDTSFRERLIKHGDVQFKRFSWDTSAIKALKSLEQFASRTISSSLTIERGYQFHPVPQDILLIKLDHLGDFILAIPAIMKLNARYPKARIDAVVGGWCVELARSLNIFNEIYSFDLFKRQSSASPGADIKAIEHFLSSIKAQYDIAIDLRRQPEGRQLLARVNSTVTVGYQTFDLEIDRQIKVMLPSERDVAFKTTRLNAQSTSTQMIALVDAIPAGEHDYLVLPELSPKHQSTELASIAVFPYAGNAVKEWGVDNFTSLIQLLARSPDVERINVYVMTEQEALPFTAITAAQVNVHSGLAYEALLKSVSDNTICIANNSFGAHIGSYLGLIVIGIYGGHETVAEWAPVFNESIILHTSAECSPCHVASKAECPYGLRCLTEIKVDSVHQEILKVLKAAKTSTTSASTKQLKKLHGYKTRGKPRNRELLRSDLIASIASVGGTGLNDSVKLRISQAIARNQTLEHTKRLCVDISMLVAVDAKSGIQRVVRALLNAFIADAPAGYEIVPVYTTPDYEGYRRASAFMHQWLNQTGDMSDDEAILFTDRDIFLGLDLHPSFVPARDKLLQQMRNLGIQVKFVVYDLLPITMPKNFPLGIEPIFKQWFDTVVKAQELICISKAVADEIRADFLPKLKGLPPMRVTHFQLGCDIENSVPTIGIEPDAAALFEQLKAVTTFLMVGTIEPRKNHEQVLIAFEQLWASGHELNLVLVGKFGWNIDGLAEKLRGHQQLGQQLFWLEGISDEYLQRLYESCDALIMASIGEGFGLPLIEAASRGLPLLATDLPVFREVAGENAYYFSGAKASHIQVGIEAWLDLYRQQLHPSSTGLQAITWKQSAQQLLKLVYA